jgi:uncharacterized membrane protein YfcA
MQIHWFKAVVIGVVAGYLSGLLGIGGGVIIVPAFVLWLRMDQFVATATSVATIAVTAGAALITFGIGDSVDWPVAAIVFIGSATGAWLGAHFLDRIPEWILAGSFSAVMTIAAVRMFL